MCAGAFTKSGVLRIDNRYAGDDLIYTESKATKDQEGGRSNSEEGTLAAKKAGSDSWSTHLCEQSYENRYAHDKVASTLNQRGDIEKLGMGQPQRKGESGGPRGTQMVERECFPHDWKTNNSAPEPRGDMDGRKSERRGAVWKDHSISRTWTPSTGRTSNQREMTAVLMALRVFKPYLKGKVVMINSDNMTTVQNVAKQGGTRSPVLLNLVKEIWKLLSETEYG